MKLPSSLLANTIKEREIFFFSTDKINTDNPHYFICIKKGANEVLLFTCCTSKGSKREKYIQAKGYPLTTLVFIKPDGTVPFTEDTYIDCNKCFTYTLAEFKALCDNGKMTYKGEISEIYYEQILIGLLESPEIDELTKKELPNPSDI